MEDTEVKIATNNFALRQVAESKFSHFSGSWKELEALVETHFEEGKQGYKDGVMLVPVPCGGFFSGVVEVGAETELKASFEARARGEAAFVNVVAVGAQKLPAKAVEIVLYRHDILAADGDASTDAEWEVVSINARPTEGAEPPTPQAMARNMLGLPGGTTATYSAEEFARSIIYWSTRVMAG